MKTLEIDADILDYFERLGPGYRTAINAALRAWIVSRGDKSS